MNELLQLAQELERNRAAAIRDARVEDAGRLFHGRGRCFPGLEQLCIDYFKPVFLVTLFAEIDSTLLSQAIDILAEIADESGVSGIGIQHRHQPGAPLEVAWGELPRKPFASEAGLNFGLQLGGRQNVGFFLDMAEARRWVASHASQKSVLNLFAYTCAFSVVARAHGARKVVNLDMSAAGLRQGQQNHQRNGLHDGVSYLAHDVFRSWGKLRREGPYDLIVVDPPSRQPGSFVAEKDYPRVIAKLPALCVVGTRLLLCLNSPHLESRVLLDYVEELAPGMAFQRRLPNPSAFVDENTELSLKVMEFAYMPSR